MPNSSAHPPRPQLLRGNTVPLYVRTQDNSHKNDNTQQPSSAHSDKLFSVGQRTQPTPSGSGTTSLSHLPQQYNLPTPPLSTSPSSAESYNTEDAYFPAVLVGRQQSSSASGTARLARQGGIYGSPVTSPTVTSYPASFQLLRNTRAPQSTTAPMRIETTPGAYVLSAAIGPGFDSSCITIAMRKNNILDIVADRWDQEKDCHHEWQVQFDRDADMSGIHASYTDGVLTVTVKRLNQASGRPPQMRP